MSFSRAIEAGAFGAGYSSAAVKRRIPACGQAHHWAQGRAFEKTVKQSDIYGNIPGAPVASGARPAMLASL
jgi:hypothetical protein